LIGYILTTEAYSTAGFVKQDISTIDLISFIFPTIKLAALSAKLNLLTHHRLILFYLYLVLFEKCWYGRLENRLMKKLFAPGLHA